LIDPVAIIVELCDFGLRLGCGQSRKLFLVKFASSSLLVVKLQHAQVGKCLALLGNAVSSAADGAFQIEMAEDVGVNGVFGDFALSVDHVVVGHLVGLVAVEEPIVFEILLV